MTVPAAPFEFIGLIVKLASKEKKRRRRIVYHIGFCSVASRSHYQMWNNRKDQAAFLINYALTFRHDKKNGKGRHLKTGQPGKLHLVIIIPSRSPTNTSFLGGPASIGRNSALMRERWFWIFPQKLSAIFRTFLKMPTQTLSPDLII